MSKEPDFETMGRDELEAWGFFDEAPADYDPVILRRQAMGRVGPDRKDWDRYTSRWQAMQSELLKVMGRIAQYPVPPVVGEEWDQLVGDYVSLKKQAEALISETIGIDTNLTGGGVRPLAKAADLTPAWVSRRARLWREENFPNEY